MAQAGPASPTGKVTDRAAYRKALREEGERIISELRRPQISGKSANKTSGSKAAQKSDSASADRAAYRKALREEAERIIKELRQPQTPATPKPQPQPEVKPKPTPLPAVTPKPQPEIKPNPAPAPIIPQPKPQPQPEVKPQPTPVTPQPKPTPPPTITPRPQPVPIPLPAVTPPTTPKPQSKVVKKVLGGIDGLLSKVRKGKENLSRARDKARRLAKTLPKRVRDKVNKIIDDKFPKKPQPQPETKPLPTTPKPSVLPKPETKQPVAPQPTPQPIPKPQPKPETKPPTSTEKVKPKQKPDKEVTESIKRATKELKSLYKELGELMASEPQSYKIGGIIGKIEEVKSRAEKDIEKLPQGKDKALSGFNRIDRRLNISILKDESQRVSSALEAVERYEGRKKMHDRYLSLKDGSISKEQLEGSKQRLEEARAAAIDYVKSLKGNQNMRSRLEDRISRVDNLDREREKARELNKKGFDENSKAAKEIMGEYKNKLDSAFSVMNRGKAIVEKIKERLKSDDLSREERNKLIKALFGIEERVKRADQRAEKLMEQIRNSMIKTKLSNEEVEKILGSVKLTGDKSLQSKVRDQLSEFVRMFNGKGMDSLEEVTINANGRAFAEGLKFIQTDGGKGSMFHEAAHVIERTNSWIRDYARKWVDSRAYTISELQVDSKLGKDIVRGPDGKLIPFSNMVDISGRDLPLYRLTDMPALRNHGFDPSEAALVDKFMSPYMGKFYLSGDTEVISMGIEKFASTKGMKELYNSHPDLFEVIVGMAGT